MRRKQKQCRFLADLLAIAMLVTSAVVMPPQEVKADIVMAEEILTDGDYEYKVLENAEAEIVKYTGSGGAIVIPSTIAEKSVTSIGEEALAYCDGLTSVTIPSSVTSIGDYAFTGCSGLTSIEIPSGVTSIGYNVFSDCTGLESMEVNNDNSKYDSREDCNAIIEKATDTLIAGYKNTKIPADVKSIGEYAFDGCIRLTGIEIPSSVTSIGKGAFADCSGLESMVVSKDNSAYDSGENCNAIIEKATNTLIAGCKNTKIPAGVTSIGYEAFSGCSGLPNIEIPSGVTSIGKWAFSECKGLTSVEMPSSVTDIGEHAFYFCEKLTSIKIPSGVTNIRLGAFSHCSRLKDIYYGGTEEQWKLLVKDKDTGISASAVIHYLGSITGGTKPSEPVQKSNQTFASCTKTYEKALGDKAFSLNVKLKTGSGALGYKTSDSKVVTVDNKGKVTIKGTGCATITVTAAGTINYNAASVTVTVTVSPKKPAVKSLKVVKGKKLTVKWVKDKNATGYEICCSTDKKFKKGVKTASIAKNATVSKTLTKLTKGKKYYVRIRAYKTAKVGGKSTKLYSVWSSAKKSGKIK